MCRGAATRRPAPFFSLISLTCKQMLRGQNSRTPTQLNRDHETASTGPVHGPAVPGRVQPGSRGCQLKKVRRHSAPLSSCSANVAEDDASIHLTTIQREAFPASPAPSAAAFAPTQHHQHPQQNVHQAVLAPNSQHTAQNSSDESVVPVAGGRTKDYCDWWREQRSEQSDLSLFNVRLIGDASSPQLFTSMAHNDLAYCRYACFWTALCRCLQQYTYLVQFFLKK